MREAADLLGVHRTRVCQLRSEGHIASSADANGRIKVDLESVERYMARRAEIGSLSGKLSPEAAALQSEATDRMKRQRAIAAAEKAERDAERESKIDRAIAALESIARLLGKLARKSEL